LSEVSRSEPLASQFQVPSGYTVEDARGPSQTLR
jgi:hypothetical protein